MSLPLLLVATDLDGTLLDHVTYSFEPALPALAALRAHGASLVLASSKTRLEMEPLAQRLAELGLRRPALIVENGGAMLVPLESGGYEEVRFGVERARLVAALAEICREAGTAVVGFSSLTAAEVAARTGLALESARQAMAREYDEPFELANETLLPALRAGASRRGLELSRGGRFFHLTGPVDKGRALLHLLVRLTSTGCIIRSIGLGDAGNDLSLLRAVDRPIVIPRPDGRPEAELVSQLPAAELAPASGPLGWNAAITTVLAGGRLPRVGGFGLMVALLALL